MKKVLFPLALVAVMILGSCSGSSSEKQGFDLKAKIENCTNTDSIAAYVNDAKAYVQKLIDDGKVDEAKKYLAELEPVVQEKAPQLAGAFEAVKSVVDKVPTVAATSADKAKEAASVAGDSIASAADNAKDAVVDKYNDVKDAVVDKTVDVKDAVVDKTVEVKDAVVDKAVEVKDATKDKVNDLLNK